MESKQGIGPTPAYLPLKTLMTASDVLRGGVPPHIDRTLWPSLSGGMQSWVMSAFRFLEFIDEDDAAQPILHEWVHGNEEARKSILTKLLREKYPTVIALAEQHGSPRKFDEAMEEMGLTTPTTRTKAKYFFLQAADLVGISVPDSWRKQKRSRGSAQRQRQAAPKKESNPVEKEPTHRSSDAENSRTVRLQGDVTVSVAIRGNLWTNPREDREWVGKLMDLLDEYERDNRQSSSAVA